MGLDKKEGYGGYKTNETIRHFTNPGNHENRSCPSTNGEYLYGAPGNRFFQLSLQMGRQAPLNSKTNLSSFANTCLDNGRCLGSNAVTFRMAKC